METFKHIITKLLVGFALISIGFALGKHSVKTNSKPVVSEMSSDQDYIAVYYMHSTFRCATCNQIETMTKAVLDKNYAEQLKDKRIHWKDIDFQEDEVLAKKFSVIASCVVVAQVTNGKISDFKRLDKVWTLMNDTKAFDNYISQAINSYQHPKTSATK